MLARTSISLLNSMNGDLMPRHIHVGTPWSPLLRSTNAANINVIIHNEKCFLLRNSILALCLKVVAVVVVALVVVVVVMDELVAVDGPFVVLDDIHQRRCRNM